MLPVTKMDVQRALPGELGLTPEDVRWILEDLEPMRRREGAAMVEDWLGSSDRTTFQVIPGQGPSLFRLYYRCRWFDRETRTCQAYDRRPPICREYPWGNDPADAAKALPPECAFNEDVGRPVKLLPTRHAEATQEGAAALSLVRCVVGLALALVIIRDAALLSGWDRLGLVVVALVVLVVTLPPHTR